MLDSRKRLLGGAVITVVGLGTALLFRKPPEEPRSVSWPSGFTTVEPSAPITNPAPPEPVQPRLAGRIEALADANAASANPPAPPVSLYQMPGNSTAPGTDTPSTTADPFLRAGSAFSQPSENAAPTTTATDAAKPAGVYSLTELKPLVPTEQPSTPATTAFTEPAKLDPVQQAAANPVPAAPAVEHSSGYRWSPNRSSTSEPSSTNENLSLAERPSLLAPPPMQGLPNVASAQPAAAPAANYQMPPSNPSSATPSLSLPSTGFAPAPLLSSAPPPLLNNSPFSNQSQSNPPTSGMRHRIVDGDTLGTIARLYYGDEQRARELYEANRDVLRDPELLPIGTELMIPGASANTMPLPAAQPMSQTAQPMSQTAQPMSQAVPPLLTPPAIEQFGPRTLAVSNSAWRGANEPPIAAAPPAAPLAPVALTPWDQQLANAAPLQSAPVVSPLPVAEPLATPSPVPAGWPPAGAAPAPLNMAANNAAAPQVGWPPRPAEASASWPARTWNTTESALNWVGDKVLGTGAPAAPTAVSKTYLVKPLETWETLAQRFYGDSRYATTLQNANQQIPAGSKIRPGSVINVPNMPL